MVPAQFIDTIVSIIGFGLLIWFLKRALDRLERNITKVTDSHNECRATLTKRFADRKDTRDDLKELFNRTEAAEKDVSYLKGRGNGATVQ
jgi:hypothetical protein